MELKDIKPGDIITLGISKRQYYVFKGYEGNLLINACNPSWIERGLRMYGEECYLLENGDLEISEIVGHFGNGLFEDGRKWFSNHVKQNGLV